MPEQQRVRLKGLSVDAFVSPTDRVALQNLQKLPLLPQLVQKFNEYAIDRLYRVQNTSTSIKCGPQQFPTLHGLLREACDILDVPEPELYLSYSPYNQAYTAGVQRPFIVLHSSMVEDYSDEELLFVLGHELGHIKCGHVLYGMLGRFLLPLLNLVGQATLGVGQLLGRGLVASFFEWMRQAEFTGDRAGLLACQDHRVACSALMRMGCGSTRLNDEMNVDAFLEQARHHSDIKTEGITKALMFLMYNWHLDHPQVVFRAKGLDEWFNSGNYHGILSGHYPRNEVPVEPVPPQLTPTVGSLSRCDSCKGYVTLMPRDTACPECGAEIPGSGEAIRCSCCELPLHPAARFCGGCGTPVKRNT